VCAVGVPAAANKESAAGIRDPGVRRSFPSGDVEAASAWSRWDFVPPDLLLPWRRVSGSVRDSGGKSPGDGRRRAPASSRRLLHRSGKRYEGCGPVVLPRRGRWETAVLGSEE
jgi:hypothetical protein